MSLINKMLQDLESRKNPQAEATQKKSVYEDLKPLSRVPSSRAPSRRLMVLLAAVVVAGAGVYAWTQWGNSLVSSLFPDQIAAKSPPVVARKSPPPKPAPVPAPAPATVATVTQATEVKTSPAPPAVATDKAAETPVKVAQAQVVPPAAAEPKKSEAAPAPAAPKKAAPAKSKAAAAVEAGYWTVSRGETLYGISAQTGVELWNLSGWNKLGREHVIHSGQRLRLTPPAAASATAETRPAKEEKAGPAEKQKTAAASTGTTGAQKSETEAKPTVAPSAREIQTGNAVMDKKIKPLSSDEKAESEYRRAIDLLQKGRMADAEKLLKSAMNANEAHTQARELLAGVMLQQGHWREAQQILEQGIDKVPAYYPFAQLLARVYVEHGAEQKALTVMEAGRRAAADNPDYVAFLAALYQRAGKHAEAVKAYTETVALNPQEGRWWLGMGISQEALQDWNAAGTAYQRAIDSGVLDDNLLKYARQRLTIVKNK
ncbi:MAG: tetratricopeptide repeat protein [Gammaproteobacteria bacterium]|nr:tetratricopeptide repeat protein [Gammaproteobacteria bacterium]